MRASTPRRLGLARRRARRPPPRRASASRSSSSSAATSSDSRQVAHDRRRDRARRRPRIATLTRSELPRPQRQPELDPVARAAQVAAGQLLDAADPVAQRVAVAVELARRALPLAVLLDERLERAQQLVAVLAAAVLERAEQRVAVEPQRLVVLEREDQLEGAEVAVGGDLAARCRWRCCAASSAQRASWNARRSVVRPARGATTAARTVAERLRACARRGQLDAGPGPPPRRPRTAAGRGVATRRPATPASASAALERRPRRRPARAARRTTITNASRLDAERREPRLQVGLVEPPGQRLGEHVAGQPPLGVAHDALAHQLERDDGDGLLEQQPLERAERPAVAHRDEPGLRRRPPTGSASARPPSSGCSGANVTGGVRALHLRGESPRARPAGKSRNVLPDASRSPRGPSTQAAPPIASATACTSASSPPLLEHHPLEPLVDRDAALEHLVLLVHERASSPAR